MSDREIPATSWAVWAWQAYRDGRLVEADSTEELEAERDEALNQLDSARHSVEVLEKRVSFVEKERKKTFQALLKATKRHEELEAAIKRQAGAARTLRQLTLAEVQHLSEMDRSEYFAAHTLDSERDANAILTDRIEELEAKLAKAVDALVSLEKQSSITSSRGAARGPHWTQLSISILNARTTLVELKGEKL